MKRMVCVGIAALAALGACGKSGSSSQSGGSGSGGSAQGGSGAQVGSNGSAQPAPPATSALVALAFGGKAPAFPLLDAKGGTAAFALDLPVNQSDVSTYSVAFVAWGQPEQMPIVDATMAKMLLDAEGGEPAPTPDPGTLKARGEAVAKRLAEGGFTAFDHPATALQLGDAKLGDWTVQAKRNADGSLGVHLLDATGKDTVSDAFNPKQMARVADAECIATPRPDQAWLDAARKRVLVSVAWTAGADACEVPDPEYRLWTMH